MTSRTQNTAPRTPPLLKAGATWLLALAPIAAGVVVGASASWAGPGLFKIDGDVVTQRDIYQDHQNEFYTIEKEYYRLVSDIAKKHYLRAFFNNYARRHNYKSLEQAEQRFLASRIRPTEAEIASELQRFQFHPKIVNLTGNEKRKKIVRYIKSYKKKKVLDRILKKGFEDKKIEIMVPKPVLPIYRLEVRASDPVRYTPIGSENLKTCDEDCPITVIEYSEFECPYCRAVQPTIQKLLSEYQGKVRWVIRDFPIYVHRNAKPAAIAARCAKEQGKYWEMYQALFERQYALSYADFLQYGKKIGLYLPAFEKCLAFPEKVEKIIDENYESGKKLKITGTPTFFINGRKHSGALSYPQLKSIFEEELTHFKLRHSETPTTVVGSDDTSGAPAAGFVPSPSPSHNHSSPSHGSPSSAGQAPSQTPTMPPRPTRSSARQTPAGPNPAATAATRKDNHRELRGSTKQ